MKPLSATSQLKISITSIELKHRANEQLLIDQFRNINDSLKPANIVSKIIGKFIPSPSFTNSNFSTILGIALGYISKKITVNSSNNKFKKILGSVLQTGITHIVARNPDTIKSIISFITKLINSKKETNSPQS